MKKKENIFWIFLLINFFAFGQNQSKGIDSLAVRLVRSLRSDVEENIFIHTDKSVYKAGETIWFNAYQINKVSHKLSHYSDVVFVDLVNEKDSIISQLILNPGSLRLNGGIPLPIVLQEGDYWLRGYTSNILRTDSNDICVHPIYIVNPQNISATNAKNEPDITPQPRMAIPKFEIYPEGGSIIAGVTSVLAFRVTDQNNNPLEVEGYLKDNRDTITTRFKTSLPGLGKFSFFPWKIRQYKVYIRTKDGFEFSYPLPQTGNYAASISVVGEDQNSVKVLVALGDSLYDKNAVTYLLGISRDSVCFAGIGQRMYESNIPKRNFPQGEATLLLFDEHEQLLSERNVYMDLNSAIVNIQPDKENYLARQNAVLDISIHDGYDRPALSLLTASVTDDSSVRYFDDHDIAQMTEEKHSAEERDLVMITQKNKYRKWAVSDSAWTTKYPGMNDDLFTVHGIAMNQKGRPLPGVVVTLISTQPENIFATDTTNEDGRFNLILPGYHDSTEFILQASDKKGKAIDAKMILDPLSLPKFNTPLNLKKNLPADAVTDMVKKKSEKRDFLLPGKGKELKEVIVRSRIKKPLSYDEKQRVSQFSKILTADMIRTSGPGSVANALLFIPGVQLRNRRLVLSGSDAEPLLVMDGVQFDTNALKVTSEPGTSPLMSFLNTLSLQLIDFIEVLNGADAAIYGMQGGNGVIIIHTLSQVRNNTKNDKVATMNFYRTGYSNSPLFTEPDYTKKEIRKINAPDQRSTIYWSGPVITDNNGKTTLNFFTADPGTTYTVTIKGITVSGDIFLKRFLISRK